MATNVYPAPEECSRYVWSSIPTVHNPPGVVLFFALGCRVGGGVLEEMGLDHGSILLCLKPHFEVAKDMLALSAKTAMPFSFVNCPRKRAVQLETICMDRTASIA